MTTKKSQSSVLKFRNVQIYMEDDEIKLPKFETIKGNYRFTTLLKKIKSMQSYSGKKYKNRIILIHDKGIEKSPHGHNLYTNTWKFLAEEHKAYTEMYKTVEIQNQRISRLKIKK